MCTMSEVTRGVKLGSSIKTNDLTVAWRLCYQNYGPGLKPGVDEVSAVVESRFFSGPPVSRFSFY